MTRVRAAVVVTGTELVRGDRTDLNGPFLARELNARGLEAARVTIVGDRPDELLAALEEGLRADLLVVSGGLGPTHDDRTVELLARAAGRSLVVDRELEAEIEGVSRRIAERLERPYGEFAPGVTKQASLPEGAVSLGLAGTAPGIVLDTGSCVAVTLPGPPPELRRLWANAVESDPVRRLFARAEPPERRTLRYYGVSESAVARVLLEAGGEQGGVEATVCARDFEIHVDLVGNGDELAIGAAAGAGRLSVLRRRAARRRDRPRRVPRARPDPGDGGVVHGRARRRAPDGDPGASDVFLGGIVAYANEVKVAQLEVPAALLDKHGAVSAEVAQAMAEGVRSRLGADVGMADTGVAGPAGGTPEKPVGTVYLDARAPGGGRGMHFVSPGERGVVRRRAAVAALHLVRRILGTER